MQYFLSFIVNYYKGLQRICKPEYIKQIERKFFHRNSFYFLLEAKSIENEESFTVSYYNI